MQETYFLYDLLLKCFLLINLKFVNVIDLLINLKFVNVIDLQDFISSY
jgi:hypothetical protein